MRKSIKISIVIVCVSTGLFAGADQMKLYGVESGKIDYKITGSGDIMGVETKTVGKKRVIFKDFGAKSLTEENEVKKTVMGGNSNVEKNHKITIMDGAMLYTVDVEKQKITRMQNPAVAMMGAMGGGKNAMTMGENMLKKMGGKKTGTDKVLGYSCDVWEAMGTKQCIYKGIPLKIESNIMGIKEIEVATKAEFDISIPDSTFKLPDYPVYDMYGNKLDKSSLSAMDAREKKEAEQGAEALAAAIGAMAAAAKSAGIKPGQQPTAAQKKDLENAMMAAMLPQMKKEAIADEKMMLEAKECFSKADSLEEAKACSKKMGYMGEESGDMDDGLEDWSANTKQEVLKSIDMGLENISCVKKVKSMDEMQSCMQ